MENITGFRRIFNPDQKCKACNITAIAGRFLYLFFFKDGTSKQLHADCQKS